MCIRDRFGAGGWFFITSESSVPHPNPFHLTHVTVTLQGYLFENNVSGIDGANPFSFGTPGSQVRLSIHNWLRAQDIEDIANEDFPGVVTDSTTLLGTGANDESPLRVAIPLTQAEKDKIADIPLTASEIKTLYESNPDTNVFTNNQEIKLQNLPPDPIRWRGSWTPRAYAVSNVVIFNSGIYFCIVGRNASNTDNPETDTSSWLRLDGSSGGASNASEVTVKTSAFDGNLTSAQDTVQKALDRLDLSLIHISEPTRPY